MTTKIPKAVLRRAVEALRHSARAYAGLSQAPYLFTAEETQEWADANTIARALRAAGDTDIEVEEP
jgi:hypothetical protein